MSKLQNIFSWSKSRDENFRECPYKYYLHYYASWGGWDASADARTRQIYMLKNLKTRQMWMGEVVHHAVENSLKHYQRTRELPTDVFLDQITQRMRREFRDSRAGRYRQEPKKSLGLFEHEYEKTISDERWATLHDDARRCYTGFANFFFTNLVKPVPVNQWRLIETMQTFTFERSLIYVKIDFAFVSYENNDSERSSELASPTLYIIDWKTGKTEDVDNEIQLDCYGMFSKEAFTLPTERIFTIECNLNLLKESRRQMIEAKIDFAKHYIRNSIAGMKRVLKDPEVNIPKVEEFPFTENEKTCQWCNFRKVCPKWA